MEQHEANNFGPPSELPQPEVGIRAVPEQGLAAHPEIIGNQMPAASTPVQAPDRATSLDPASIAQPSFGQSAMPAGGQTTGMIADDADLIEKEWVIRAKGIVLQTKDDPHTQNREMNKVKADYLKKRYNKDLKVIEG